LTYASDVAALQAAVTAAQQELVVRETAAQISATPANVAAVAALRDRLTGAEQALNDYLALHQQPTTPITQPTIGLSGPQPDTPAPPATVPIPVPPPNNEDNISAATIAAALDGYLSGDDEAVGNYLDANGTPPTVEDAWEYFVNQIDEVFTGLEDSFDGLAATAADVSVAVDVAEVSAGLTADIGGIEVVGFGLALLAGEYITGWILQKVGAFFPNPSIFGWHPLNFISEGITNVGNQLAGSAENLAVDVVNFITQPVRQLTGLFQRIFNSHAGSHNAIATLHNTTIPNATAGLLTSAESYTDSKVEVSLTQAESYTNSIRTDLEGEITTARAEAEQAALTDATNVQSNLVTRLQGDEATLSALSTEITTTIPNELETQINESVATENQELTAATSTIENQIAQITAQIDTLNNQIAKANATIATAGANIVTLQNQSVVDEGAIAQEQTTIQNAQADIATNTTTISTLYTQITGISDTLAPIKAAQTLQTQQISTINTDLDTTLPLALATISTALQSLKTEVDECMVDNCDTANPNNIRNVLRDLLGLLVATAEIGFIAEAVKDPLGTASALAPLLDTIDSSAVDTLNLLLEL
jgi:hypothetical protein